MNKRDKLLKSRDSLKLSLDFLNYLRSIYLKRHLTSKIKNTLNNLGLDIPAANITRNEKNRFLKIIKEGELDWGDSHFHLKYRITKLSDLTRIKPDFKEIEGVLNRDKLQENYLLSILPLNLLSPPEVLKQFLPPSDFFIPHPSKDVDPYGIALTKAKIEEGGRWIGSKKFDHSILMNIHGDCPLGCSDCYKSYFTREKGHAIELGAGDPYDKIPTELREQTRSLIKWLNNNPQVYDVIISGGEPFLRPNSHIGALLRELKKAKHLKILRFCTGTIFLGLPFRIDDELLSILREFSEVTGIKITFQAHISNHFQINPESIIATNKIKSYGFSIYSQTPIRKGINFFFDDFEKTIYYFRELVRKQFLIGVEPYKFIVDMHPRTLNYYVPIEALVATFSCLFDSHSIPELERPKTLSILTKQGNFILTWHSLFAMKKTVDYHKKLVKYQIPKILFVRKGRKIKNFVYVEPLSSINEDPNSLKKIRDNWFK